jgi:aspartyl/asparaginyl beta-hydroxylase (cupin superfamily)
MSTAPSARSPEPVFYYIVPEWYKGSEPGFYDVETLPGTKILRENYAAIRREAEAYYAAHGDEMKANFTPYAYREAGWQTVTLYSYFLRYEENCAKFPVIHSVVRQIPGMCLAQLAVLKPHTRIKAHFGDTNVIVRSHLGLVVPGTLPDIGIQVGRERQCWKEGDVLALQIARRHYAWNCTDHHRIVLVVDTFRPEYMERRYEIAGNVLATIAMKYFATRFPPLKKLPRPLVKAMHRPIGLLFRLRLWAQRTLRLGPPPPPLPA